MTMWLPDLAARSGPAYLAIADAIGVAINAGRLRAGARLPPQRDLAYALGLSLNTVTRAYAEAIRRGLLAGEVGRGTYVRAAGRHPAGEPAAAMIRPARGPIDFAQNLPLRGGAEPALERTLAAISSTDGLAALLDDQRGADPGRHADVAAGWIAQLGLTATGRRVILTNGAQHAVFVALLALTRPGDAILVEELSYPPVRSMARHLGLTILPVALDEDGLRPDSLEALCRTTAARVLYCMPTLHTPTTVTMSAGRRQSIAAVVERHGLHVIEDDVFGFLPRDRPAPLAAFAPDRTLFVTSVSKSLAPGLRVGYLQTPSQLEGALRSAVAVSCWMPPPLMAEIATRWIEDGTATQLNEVQRSEAAFRQGLARDILAGHDLRADPCGFHVWLPLPDHWRPDAFQASARQQNVDLRSGDSFAMNPKANSGGVRLCLSHEIDRDRVSLGLQRIARLLQAGADDGAFVV